MYPGSQGDYWRIRTLSPFVRAEQLTLWEASSAPLQEVVTDETAGPPTPAAQRALLARVRQRLEPLRASEGLPDTYVLEPGLRLRSSYGRCTFAARAIVIQVRCTADGDPRCWRRVGAITSTLLHELAHLRYRSHGPRFWMLYRRLVTRAASAGLYDPTDRDPRERPRGERKLGTRYALRS